MTDIFITPPTDKMLHMIAGDVEESDRLELAAMQPDRDIFDILQQSVRMSFESYVAVVDGVPAAAFGIAIADQTNTDLGVPWAVFTPQARKAPVSLMRSSQAYVDKWRHFFPVLTNMVDIRNERAIEWLERLGFNMEEELPVASGQLFYRFEMITHV